MRLFHLNSLYLLEFMVNIYSLQKHVLNKHKKTFINCSTWQLLFSGRSPQIIRSAFKNYSNKHF